MENNSRPIRIAIDCRTLGRKRTGDEVYVRNLVLNLMKIDKVNQYFLLFDREIQAGELCFEVSSNFHVTAITPGGKFLWTMYYLPKWIKANKIDVLHVQYITPFWLPQGTKLVTTIHDVSWKFYPQYIKKSDLFFLNTLIPVSLKKADKIITVSETSKKDIVRIYGLPEEKVAAIYNGVGDNFKSYVNSAGEEERVKKKYNLPDNFILYLGTLQPRKNVPSLLEAFYLWDKEYAGQARLVIGGGKSYNYDNRIDGLINEHNLKNKITLTGYIEDSDLPAIYKLAKAFVFPSLYEGFGIPVIEAMAVGTPVIVSDQSCLPEVAGEAGLVVDPGDKKKFAEAIHRIMTDEKLRGELAGKGRERAAEFNWEETAKKTLKIYTTLNE